jgi:hypothetical protein
MDRWKRFFDWCRRPNMIKIHAVNSGIGKAELFRGAKAGAVSGIIYGPVNWLIINIGINLPYGNLGNWVARIMTNGMWALNCIIMNLIPGAILGLIFGLIFATLYDKLPGKTPPIKGIVISIIYWVAIPLGLPVLSYLNRWGSEGLYEFFSSSSNWMPTVIGLGALIIWGWLLGRFWESERFGEL